MEKEFVLYELAVELKEMGFDEPCLACYLDGKFVVKLQSQNKQFEFFNNSTFSIDNSFASPLFQQAFRWFREKYPNIEFILPMKKKKDLGVFWGGGIKSEDMNFPKSYGSNFKTYEQAELECLKQLIKIAKNEPK